MSKIEELKSVIGKEVSENFSPTLRAKLVSINETAGICVMEVVKSPYPEWSWSAQQNHTAGHKYERPLEYVWNAFFF
jgi:hypothetical protein